jgi:RNA polymerase sigma factor (sigma-70 family)
VEGRPLDDGQLIERARGGDIDAYEELVRRYQAVAVRTAAIAGGSDAEAEDAAQEGFVKAYRALDRFRPGAPFRPWLLRIVANEALNRRRSTHRHEALALRVAEDRPTADAAPSVEEAVLAQERREELTRAIALLRPEDRLVIGYRYFLGLGEEEMAVALDVARGTVKSRLSRALGRLRDVLVEQETAHGGVVRSGGLDGG